MRHFVLKHLVINHNDGGDDSFSLLRYEIDMTCPDNTTRGVYRGRDTECVVASLLPGRPYMFQVRIGKIK